MYTMAWPITGILVCGLVAVLGEMASAYHVAGTPNLSTNEIANRVDRRDVHLVLPALPLQSSA